MAGNKIINKKQNARSYLLFFSLYIVSVVLISITVYRFAKIPNVAISEYEKEKGIINFVNNAMLNVVETAKANEGGSINSTRKIGTIATEVEKEVQQSSLTYEGCVQLLDELIQTREENENSPQNENDLRNKLTLKEKEIQDFKKEIDKLQKQLQMYMSN